MQGRRFLLYFQKRSSRGKFVSCLNRGELTAGDSPSLSENSSLLTRSLLLRYVIYLIIVTYDFFMSSGFLRLGFIIPGAYMNKATA